MRARGVWLATAAVFLLASAPLAWPMELRDMPPWLRDMIETVHLTTPDGEALAETVGVHIWASEQPVGVHTEAAPIAAPVGFSQPSRERVSIGGGDDAPGATTTTGVRAPGVSFGSPETHTVRGAGAPAPTETSGVSLGTLASPLTGSVRAPGTDEALSGGAVTISPMAAEWDEMLGSIDGLDRETLAQAGQILTMIREQNMAPEQFMEWATEHKVTPEVLTAAVALTGRDWRQSFPGLSLEREATSAALLNVAGPELEHLWAIPAAGRFWLAMYLGVLGKAEQAAAVVASLSDDDLVRGGGNLSYLTCSHLLQNTPDVALPLLRRVGRAFHDERHVCRYIMAACIAMRGTAVVREELLPYAREALAAMPPTDDWYDALWALLWGYTVLGDDDGLQQAASHWIDRLEALDVDTSSDDVLNIRYLVARSMSRQGRHDQAAEELREIVLKSLASPSRVADEAQRLLLELGAAGHTSGNIRLLPPQLDRVSPRELHLLSRVGGAAIERTLVVHGNSTLDISCSVDAAPWVDVGDVGHDVDLAGAPLRIGLTLGPFPEAGEYTTTLHVSTNDAAVPTVRIPISVRVLSCIRVSPPELFFGLLKPNLKAVRRVTIMAPQGFSIDKITVDDPDLVDVRLEERNDGSHLIEATFTAPDSAGTVQGTIKVSTVGPSASSIDIRYYAEICRAPAAAE